MGYCDWVLKQEDVKGRMLEFQAFLRSTIIITFGKHSGKSFGCGKNESKVLNVRLLI